MVFVLDIINLLFSIYMYMIIGYVFMSWVPQVKESSFGQILGRLVEPYLGLFRRIIPPLGMIDFSPIIAIIALSLAQSGLVVIIRFVLNQIGL